MKHIIVGGDGFVGNVLAQDLSALGEEVIVADIVQSSHRHYDTIPFVQLDVTDPTAFAAVPLGQDDVIYNLSARMADPLVIRSNRQEFFWAVNYDGTENLLAHMARRGASKLVHFTTDMVYGHSQSVAKSESHPTEPLGEQGLSKLATEDLCRRYRNRGMQISIFRPCRIIGPGGREKLFRWIDLNLPVPIIGSGRNHCQFLSVFDCASAAVAAWHAGIPNAEYNIGSRSRATVRELLWELIDEAGSRSFLVPMPAPLMKAGLDLMDWLDLPLMDPEHYRVADEVCVLDTDKAERELGWFAQHRDADMWIGAYREYCLTRQHATSPRHRVGKSGLCAGAPVTAHNERQSMPLRRVAEDPGEPVI